MDTVSHCSNGRWDLRRSQERKEVYGHAWGANLRSEALCAMPRAFNYSLASIDTVAGGEKTADSGNISVTPNRLLVIQCSILACVSPAVVRLRPWLIIIENSCDTQGPHMPRRAVTWFCADDVFSLCGRLEMLLSGILGIEYSSIVAISAIYKCLLSFAANTVFVRILTEYVIYRNQPSQT